MPNPFEQPPMPSPEEELEQEPGDAREKEVEEIKEEVSSEAEQLKEQKEEPIEKIEAVLDMQEKTAEIEEKISMRNLPEKEASLFDRAKERLKENLRNAALFGIMATSLLGAGCKEKTPERHAPDRPEVVQVEKGEKKIIIDKNGNKVVTTERAQRMLEEGRQRAKRIIEQQRELVNMEMEKMDRMRSKEYVESKIEAIVQEIKTLKEGGEKAWEKEIDEKKREVVELVRILKTGKSEDYVMAQRQGFKGWLKAMEKPQAPKKQEENKQGEKKTEIKKTKSIYNDEVTEGPDLSRFDPTLR